MVQKIRTGLKNKLDVGLDLQKVRSRVMHLDQLMGVKKVVS